MRTLFLAVLLIATPALAQERCSPSIRVDHAALLVQIETLRQQGKPAEAWAAWTLNGSAMGDLAGAVTKGCLSGPVPVTPGPAVVINYQIGKVYQKPYPSSIQTMLQPGVVVAYAFAVPATIPGSHPARATKGVRISFGSIPTDQIPMRGKVSTTPGDLAGAAISVGAGSVSIDLGGAVQPGVMVYGNITADQASNTVFAAYAY